MGSARTFHMFVERFLNNQMSFAALPLLLQEEVKGMTFSMACEFLSVSGYPDYVKPDAKIKGLLYDIGVIDDKDNYEVLKFIKALADGNDTRPWIVNQILLLCSGEKQRMSFLQHIAPILNSLPNT
jgi:hypothetical protein